MPSPALFAVLGGTLVVLTQIPQVWRTCVLGHYRGLSVSAVWTAHACGATWLVFGIANDIPAEIRTNVPFLILNAWLIIALTVRSAQARERVKGLALTWLAWMILIVAAMLLQLTLLLGLLTAAMSVGACLPQLVTTFRHRNGDLSGLSMANRLLTIATTASWLCFGIGTGQLVISVSCIMRLAINFMIAVMLHRNRSATAAAPPLDELEMEPAFAA